eukprot:CAMPEP_0194134924 /NCGR_PEP_ID=MMETSP0152-20130528/4993_1 /TAXON_ID=1049557 /ORGANISM="Thalassiothrix antarctica, Strain L6-D1" /LENGTH=239 /DNA_ID=CAMNT_0038830885 /DNA_START=207 /DNA_END=926 /DNA_ORIENTATION=+
MKLSLALAFLGCGASAFTASLVRGKNSILSMADVSVEEEMPEIPAFPTVNGWTADPSKFCAGLPGAVSPLGEFDPLGFTKDLPVQEIKRFREAEVTHGRVAMLATLGYLVAEKFHPLFGGEISGPANSHLGQVQEKAPFFFAFLVSAITTSEIFRAITGWERPTNAISKNQYVEAKTWLSKLNDDYYPGDIGFDPLSLKPEDATEFAEMQSKELNNGRLAMIAAIGMIVQEQLTGQTLF